MFKFYWYQPKGVGRVLGKKLRGDLDRIVRESISLDFAPVHNKHLAMEIREDMVRLDLSAFGEADFVFKNDGKGGTFKTEFYNTAVFVGAILAYLSGKSRLELGVGVSLPSEVEDLLLRVFGEEQQMRWLDNLTFDDQL